MAKLSPTAIKNRLNNIKSIKTGYARKIKAIGEREKAIVADALSRHDQKKLAAIRKSLGK